MRTGHDGYGLNSGVVQTVHAVTVCMYAEFARCCFLTAQTYATHAQRFPRVLVEDLIQCMHREILHPSGSVAHMRDLLDYIVEHGELPHGREGVVSPEWVKRIFLHYDGVAPHLEGNLESESNNYNALGDMLFTCMTTGKTMTQLAAECATTSAAVHPTAPTALPTGATVDDDAESTRNNNDNDDEEEEDAFHYAGRGHCLCAICQSVNVARVRWVGWQPNENTTEHRLKAFADSFEQRLVDIAEMVYTENLFRCQTIAAA